MITLQLPGTLFLICAFLSPITCQQNTRTQATKPAQEILFSPLKEAAMLNHHNLNGVSMTRIRVVGAFTNVKTSGEHAYGYSIELWQQKEEVFGLFTAQNGLAGDPPTGLLENVKFDPRTKELSFKARLSLGLLYTSQYQGVPSRDIFEFRGILNKDQITGSLEVSNALLPNDAPKRERITLHRSVVLTEVMESPQDYNQWNQYAQEILKFRGPKW